MTGIWKTWMTLWAFGVVLFGAVLAGAAIPQTEGLARTLIVSFGQLNDGSAFDLREMRFATGLMGAVTFGWGLTILLLLPAIHAAGAPAWRALTLAMAAWFVVDSTISVATGFWTNAVSNTALAVAFLIPVLASGALPRGVR